MRKLSEKEREGLGEEMRKEGGNIGDEKRGRIESLEEKKGNVGKN